MKNQSTRDGAAAVPGWLQLRGAFIMSWKVSSLRPKAAGGVAEAEYIGLGQREAGWQTCKANPADGFVNVHDRFGGNDGLAYLGCRLPVATTGEWELALGHDGGVRVFVDGRCVLAEPQLRNPAVPGRSRVRVPFSRGRHEVVVAFDLTAGWGWGICMQATPVTERPAPLVISDMTNCTPSEGLAERHRHGHWKVMPYATAEFSGNGLWALEKTDAPELNLPLNATGWHAIYLGLLAPGSPNAIRIKLSGDAAFQHRGHTHGVCEEVLFKCADLTGQSLRIAQQTAGLSRPAGLAYVKLVPLTAAEVDALQRDRGQRETRRLIGTIDGFSFIYARRPTTKAELLEEFEPYRDSDFGTIWWQFCGADLVNYRSRLGTIPGEHTDDFVGEGDRHFTEAVQTLIARDIDITKVAVDACHDLGMEVHIALRPGAWKCSMPADETLVSDFYRSHPEWRCRDRDGTSVTRMSFAVPEVRRHLLGIFREVLEAGPDGLNVLYNRAEPFVLWEDAFSDKFRDLHGEDARSVPENDARIYDLRAEFLTQWMREVRQLLDDFQCQRGLQRRLALSALCPETEAESREFGLDIARWVREGLIDQIAIIQWPGNQLDLDWYKRITAGTSVPVHPGLVGWKITNADAVLRQVVEWEHAGVDGLSFWDPSGNAEDGLLWPIISRLGHTEETRERLATGASSPVVAYIRELGDEPSSRWRAGSGF